MYGEQLALAIRMETARSLRTGSAYLIPAKTRLDSYPDI